MTALDVDEYTKVGSWPFEEARKLLTRLKQGAPKKGYVLFETGYGPPGLPHIGTFMEVFRTTLVRHAFAQMSDIPTKLFAVSDDMDGLRKVPENIPNQEMVAKHLGKPLTKIPDPFGTHESFGHHMNARLCGFLDQYGFEYEFISSSDFYRSGKYDKALLSALAHYDKIMQVMLPTLGEERQKTYSPFLPISPKTGKVLQVPMDDCDPEQGTITFTDEDGEQVTLPVTGGHCKLQWKPDFGMRWAALEVDFEMFGKDHQPSAPLYSAICKIVGGRPPQQYVYEMFLDAEGKKISKSKGNGISMEQWLRYGTPESLAYYMYQNPRKARRLHFDVIPKAVDEYYAHLAAYAGLEAAKKPESPVWHIHGGEVPKEDLPVSFGLLLNLASVCHPENPEVLWGFIQSYAPDVTRETHPWMEKMIEGVIAYYEDFVLPAKSYRTPDAKEEAALKELQQRLQAQAEDAKAEELQTLVFSVGKAHDYSNLRDWFAALYAILLGQESGPRMGSFIALYGVDNTVKLIDKALKGSL